MIWKVLLKAFVPAIALLFLVSACGGDDEEVKETPKTVEKPALTPQKILAAERSSNTTIQVSASPADPSNTNTIAKTVSVIWVSVKNKNPDMSAADFVVREYGQDSFVQVFGVKALKGGKEALIYTDPLEISNNYEAGAVTKSDTNAKTNYFEVQFGDAFWEGISSTKPLGNNMENGDTVFRVFAPRAQKVLLCLFDRPYAETYGVGVPYPDRKDIESNLIQPKFEGETQIAMTRDADGVWECRQKGAMWGKLYGYRVFGPKSGSEMFNPGIIVADPYSRAIATKELSPQQQLTVIVDPSVYKWESKQKYAPVTRREAIIYEAHVRDMTMLSPDIKNKGTYEGLVEEGKTGGINHVKNLGANIIELMPTQEFDEIEEPYIVKGYNNNWNPYGRNHWGYMTSCFFAPESFYYEGQIAQGKWIGVSGGQIYAFKKMVDEFHKNGIGVMMDVVYNHVSQYDRNALKYIDHKYYFWLNAQGADDSKSGCGNDIKSDRPMARRLIVDSTRYWVDEYHVDGFRFDLGTIIDWKTWEALRDQVRALNPECHITAEPWMGGRGGDRDGGGYALNDNANGFDKRDLGAWNDKVRGVIRSSSLIGGKASFSEMKTAVQVYPKLFKNPSDSFNYAESHDNETLQYFIQAENKEVNESKTIIPESNYLNFCKASDKDIKAHKIAALFLLTIQGPVMIHEGQDFARSKVVFPASGASVFPPDSANWQMISNKWKDGTKKWAKAFPYMIDKDSYEKDNEDNWLNWKVLDENKDIFDYYRGLIQIRKSNPAFSQMICSNIGFIQGTTSKTVVSVDDNGNTNSYATNLVVKNTIGYIYDKQYSGDKRSFIILVNDSAKDDCTFAVDAGDWDVLADGTSSLLTGKKVNGSVTVPALTGMILAQ
jgi:pullulanase/glycogen debranching enzyme